MEELVIKLAINEVQQAKEADDQLFLEELCHLLNEDTIYIYLDFFVYLVRIQQIQDL